jgi:predicted dehydrogenase
MLRIVVVGHGLIGRQRALAVAALANRPGPRCILAATVDPVARAADAYPGIPHYATFAEVPAQSYDAAVIAVPHHLSSAIALQVLAQGKPILIEKPLAMTGAAARAIAVAGQATQSFVGYNYRYLPTVRQAFRRIAAGELGPLRSIDMFLGHGGHPKSAEGWKLRPELAGGGVILDPGVHLFDLAWCLDGDLGLKHVAATRGFWKTGIEEDIVAVLGARQLLATFRVSHIRWVNTFRIEISGENGYALIDGRGGSYGPQQIRFGRRWAWDDGRGLNQKQTEEVIDFGSHNDSLDIEMAAVVDAWAGVAPTTTDGPGPATLQDGARIAELCDQMYASINASINAVETKDRR